MPRRAVFELPRPAAFAALCFALLWAIPLPAEPIVPLCLFRWLTGIPCPLCGLTRGLFAFAKGHWTQAVHFNALTPLAFVMLLSLFCPAVYKNVRWRAPLWKVGLTAFACYGVFRVLVAWALVPAAPRLISALGSLLPA